MSQLRHLITLGLFMSASALSGCIIEEDFVPLEPCQESFQLCPEGSVAVSECAAGATCTTLEQCGSQTICQQEDTPGCEAEPSCASDEVQLAYCEDGALCGDACQGDPDCHAVSICGHTAFCTSNTPVCLAVPVCPEGSEQVDECPADATCSTQTLCGTTIQCAKTPSCRAIPVCQLNEREVPDCSDNGQPCRYVSACGATIACELIDPIECDAVPVCKPGTMEVPECLQDAACFEETLCGTTIYCVEGGGAQCQAVPTCPAGGVQMPGCPNDGSECRDYSLCGTTITCAFPRGCAPQEARGVGVCAAFFGYAWNGSECIGLGGCSCEGADCDEAYASPEACQRARSACILTD
jgi:hypothetical protein